jgi:hypothetical protein
MALLARFGVDSGQENMVGASLSRHECLMALLAWLSSYKLVEQGETCGGIMGESPANTCLGLLTLAAQTTYNKSYLLTIFLC